MHLLEYVTENDENGLYIGSYKPTILPEEYAYMEEMCTVMTGFIILIFG